MVWSAGCSSTKCRLGRPGCRVPEPEPVQARPVDPPEEAASAAAAALHGGAGGAVVATWEARQDRAGLEAANASNAPSQPSQRFTRARHHRPTPAGRGGEACGVPLRLRLQAPALALVEVEAEVR